LNFSGNGLKIIVGEGAMIKKEIFGNTSQRSIKSKKFDPGKDRWFVPQRKYKVF
jgi:hypothetical protein